MFPHLCPVLSSFLRFFLRAGVGKVQERSNTDDAGTEHARDDEISRGVTTRNAGVPTAIRIDPPNTFAVPSTNHDVPVRKIA